jgi:hypothetical protein
VSSEHTLASRILRRSELLFSSDQSFASEISGPPFLPPARELASFRLPESTNPRPVTIEKAAPGPLAERRPGYGDYAW